jgi:hypothetical protein
LSIDEPEFASGRGAVNDPYVNDPYMQQVAVGGMRQAEVLALVDGRRDADCADFTHLCWRGDLRRLS